MGEGRAPARPMRRRQASSRPSSNAVVAAPARRRRQSRSRRLRRRIGQVALLECARAQIPEAAAQLVAAGGEHLACCCQASFRAFRRLASDVEGGFELEGDAGQGLRERIMDLDGQFRPFLDFQACARMGDLFLCEPSRAPAGDGLDRAVPDDAGGEDAEQDADDDQEFRVRPPRQLREGVDAPVAADARQFRRRGQKGAQGQRQPPKQYGCTSSHG